MLLPPRTEPTVPPARVVRARLRHLRRRHRTGSLWDALTDAYVVVLALAAIALSMVSGLNGFLTSPAAVQQSSPATRYWIGTAAAVAAAGLAWHGLRAVGPLLVSPAAQTWAVSAPVERRAWLSSPLWWLLAGASGSGALVGLAGAFSVGVGRPADLGWWALAGASCGTAITALSAIAQGSRNHPRWVRRLGTGLAGTGAGTALLVVIGHFLEVPVPEPPLTGSAAAVAIAAGTLPLAVLATIPARQALSGVDRASLTTGAQFFHAATSATVLLDTSLLTGLVETRRWQRRGLVRGRPFRPASRYLVLLQAEVRRLLRHPSALAGWGILLLAMYAVGVALPSAAPATHLVLGFLAAGRLTGGLRTLSRSRALRRAIGGGDTGLRLAHLVVPALGTAVWYALSRPVVPPAAGWLDVFLLIGLIGAAYRAATRPPAQYQGVMVESPAGLIPLDILSHHLRGIDVVVGLIFVQALWG